MSSSHEEHLTRAHQLMTRALEELTSSDHDHPTCTTAPADAELLAHPTLTQHLTAALEARTHQALQHLLAHPSAWNANPDTLDKIAQRINATHASDNEPATRRATADKHASRPPKAIDIPRPATPEPPGIELA